MRCPKVILPSNAESIGPLLRDGLFQGLAGSGGFVSGFAEAVIMERATFNHRR
jgi:hypothetical protein